MLEFPTSPLQTLRRNGASNMAEWRGGSMTKADGRIEAASDADVARHLIQQFAAHQRLNTIASTIVVFGTIAVMWGGLPLEVLAGWASAQIAVGLAALWRWNGFRDLQKIPQSVGTLAAEAVVWKFLSGALWGVLALFNYLYLPHNIHPITIIIGAVVAAGGVSSLAAILPAACVFAAMAFLPFGLAEGMEGGRDGLTLAALSVVFTAMMCGMAYMRHKLSVSVFETRAENARIAAEFGTAQREWLETSDTADAFALFDEKNSLVMWNDRCARLLRIPEELLKRGTPHHAIIRAARQPVRTLQGDSQPVRLDDWTFKALASASDAEDILEYEGGVWLRRQVRHTRNGQVLVSFSDLTETIVMSQALRESEQRYREIAELSPEAILIHVDDTIVYANPAAVSLFRAHSADELIGESALKSVHPDDQRKVLARRKEISSGETKVIAPERLRRLRLDGSLMLSETNSARINWLGKPAFMVIMHDITIQTETEARLRDSEERLRAVVDNMPDSIVLKDRDLRIQLAAGKSYDQLSTIPAWRIIGKRAWDIFPPKLAEEMEQQDRKVLETGVGSEVSAEFRITDGSMRRYVSTRFPVRDAEGKIIGIGIINHDVTDRQHLEEQLHQAQKMETVGQLTGGVAHDFNNLLTVILGNLELLEEHVGDIPVAVNFLHTALRAGERGADLTQRLLAFSRRQSLHPEPVDVKVQLSNATQLLRRTLPETISLVLTAHEDMPPASIDPAQLDNAIMNLVFNARDSMESGGRITLAVDRFTPDESYIAAHPQTAPGEYIRVSVQDTGVGMDREVVARAFEPFFTTKPVGAGTGLGLSMVYGFVIQSGGFVDLQSEAGLGTEVSLYLPVSAEQAVVAGISQAPPKATLKGNETVLVVEDDADVRVLVIEILKEAGYKVIAVVDGPAALEAMTESQEIDALLSDIVLPNGMLGPDIAREMQRHHPKAGVLLMSGYARGAVGANSADIGDYALLKKPFTRAQLGAALRDVLDTPPVVTDVGGGAEGSHAAE